tara:strand:+ start:133 stop:498 length:366 start_codon:yes stop_codon:yes gene_type:complete
MNILKLTLFFLIVYLAHLFIVMQFSNQVNLSFVTKTYIFLFVVYLCVLGLKTLIKKLSFSSPFLVLSLSFLKMLAAVIYLLPLLKNNSTSTTTYIAHFFIAYFFFLIKDIVENRRQIKMKK